MLRPSFLLLASAQGRPALDEAHPLVSAAGLLDTSATHPLVSPAGSVGSRQSATGARSPPPVNLPSGGR